MSFSIRATIRAFVAPEHRLRCEPGFWRELTSELYRRSEGEHESGAFLLGETTSQGRMATRALFYDELDAGAYDSGVCILRGPSFAKLWSMCREKGLEVVADIHTHDGSAFQSESDRTNPMIAQKGHIALIAPNLGNAITVGDLAIFEYEGGHRWRNHSDHAVRYFYVGRWA